MWSVHTRESYRGVKRDEVGPETHAATWMTHMSTMVSERNQSQRPRIVRVYVLEVTEQVHLQSLKQICGHQALEVVDGDRSLMNVGFGVSGATKCSQTRLW